MMYDLIVKGVIEIAVPMLAGFFKPYFTKDLDTVLVAGARDLVAKMPAGSKEALYCGWACDSLATAWGV